LALANVGAAGVAAVAAAPAAVTARLVRLRLDSGSAPGRWALPRVDVAGVAAGLTGLVELELRGYLLTGGGLPLLLWAFGRAQGRGGAGIDGDDVVANTNGDGDSGGTDHTPRRSLPPLTSVTLTRCFGVWDLDGAARTHDPDVFPVGYASPLPRLSRVAVIGGRPGAAGRAAATGGGVGPRRRLRAAYREVDWVEAEADEVSPVPPGFEW